MQPLHAISNVIKTSLSFFVSDAIEDIADWTPEQYEIVLYKNEKGMFVTGSYQNLWASIRPLRFEGDDRLTNFEPSPIHGDETIMAKVNVATREADGTWTIDYNFSFVDVGDILPYDASNIEYALLANQAHANSVAKDLAVAS